MGFSTSGAMLIILIGILAAFSVLAPTLFSIGAATGDAFATQNDQIRDQTNTDIKIESFELEVDTEDEEGEELDEPEPTGEPAVVNVTNTGSRSLSVTDSDLLVNGEYLRTNGSDEETRIVDGETVRNTSDVWTPGAHLEVEIDPEDSAFDDEDIEANRVQVSTGNAVADSATITTVEVD